MNITFFDTETTGMLAKGAAAGSPLHPHICQLGAQLCDDNRRIVAEMNLLIKPENWGIPAEATAIHGITTEMCERFGFPIKTAATMLLRFVQRSGLIVAHNFPFDQMMVWTELIRIQSPELAVFLGAQSYCTMEASSPILNIPPTQRMLAAGINKPKSPNLTEAYAFFHDGAKFDGAHDAMEDVRACRSVYYKIQDRAATQTVPSPLEV